MKEQRVDSFLSGANAAYLEALYEAYGSDADSVDADFRDRFAGFGATHPEPRHSAVQAYFRALAQQSRARSAAGTQTTDPAFLEKQIKVLNLVHAYRSYGHHKAALDPLKLAERRTIAALDPGYHGLDATDFELAFNSGLMLYPEAQPLSNILTGLQRLYCGHYGVEYMHISNSAQVKWLQEHLEVAEPLAAITADEKRHIFDRLVAAETLEKYLAKRYVGQKRFGLEGGEALIPLLDEVIQRSGRHGFQEVVIGMAHRGRLNVLMNVMGKSAQQLFDAFEGRSVNTQDSGDVKYHIGISSDIDTPGGPVHLSLSFNPSHLEIVCPVALGSVRARLERRNDIREYKEAVPILIHGDAAVAGQGVVMELFSLSQAPGYSTGGTIHIVMNNQIGFTMSNPIDACSTLYCSDIAKIVQAPIFHVNADDPDAVIFVTRLAVDFRERFKKDVVINLIGYRRLGHNEADEPSGTSPIMYQAIKSHPSVVQLYRDQLVAAGILGGGDLSQSQQRYRDLLDQGQQLYPILERNIANRYPIDWSPYLQQDWASPCRTAVALPTLQALAQQLFTVPADFQLQTQVHKVYAERLRMADGEAPLNWGFAETMAYATLLHEGVSIRLAGQDACRGTFSHRHSVLHDMQTGETYTPLQTLNTDETQFNVYNTILSEEAVLAFEYGYSTSAPQTLVIWEAQFGDFANGAQVVIDQFISSGEQKWGRLSGLVLLLPHGYEGQGPEHSSARLERFLQLCAQQNMQVVVPTTPAQIFHLLRQQVLRSARAPLIIFSPKSLLRHRLAVSTLQALSEDGFQTVIPELDDMSPQSASRVVLCSGRVYYDLLERRRSENLRHVAIIRIEQLYPFPDAALRAVLQPYAHVTEWVWCQEEPKNQGAWHRVQHDLLDVLPVAPDYAGRPHSAAPAVGYLHVHRQEQDVLIRAALGLDVA